MDYKAVAMGLAFAFMWSSAFTSARVIVAQAPALPALALRFFLSGLLAVIIARALGQSWHLTRAQWRATIVFGICQNALYLGLFFVAMQTLEASFAAIIASSMPLLVALAGWLGKGERLRPQAVAGLLAGLGGVVLIMGTRVSGGADLFGLCLCLVGVLALTAATLSVRGASSGGNVVMIVGLQMLVGSAGLMVAVAFTGIAPFTITPSLLAAFAYTLLVPGLAATLIWFVLVNRIGPTRAATFHFLNPVFGVAIAFMILGEQVHLLDVVGVVIVTLGILAVQLSKTVPSPPS
ncbi:DMT family transporter [Rhodobacteraceae bacterium SC52]|nr:DMT family transporter [Rhodobacteraceae bacterium SC52]